MDAAGYNARELAKKRLRELEKMLQEDWCDLDGASWTQLMEGIEGIGDGSEEEVREE